MKKQIKQVIELHKSIEAEIDVNRLRFQLKSLKEKAETEIYFIGLSTYYLNQGNILKAKKVVTEGILKFPLSFMLHYNALLIYFELEQYEEMYKHLGFAFKYANKELYEQLAELQKKITEILYERNISKEFIKSESQKVIKIIKQVDGRMYPFDMNKESLIRKVLDKGTKYENLTNLYKSPYLLQIPIEVREYIKTERFEGKEGRLFKYTFKQPTLLPISLFSADTIIEFEFNGNKRTSENSLLGINQYHYFNFEAGNLVITSNKPIFIGNPIEYKDEEKKPYKLVMHLFIDGLSGEFLQEIGSTEHLPSVNKEFNNVYENTNCYATADWTYPSIAGTVTATDFSKHGQIHPTEFHDFSIKQKSLIESIKDAGYFTTMITGCWRSNPIQGYGKSFERVVFKSSIGGFGVSEMIEEVVDHLEAFKEKNNYIWLTLPDLHDIPDELYFSPLSQAKISYSDRLISKKGVTSVQTDYEQSKINRYKEELKRIDLHLGILFKHLKSLYKEEEMLIIVHSDHGQGYLKQEETKFLNKYRTKVPFYILGGNVESKKSNLLMSNFDIYPTVLNLLNIPFDKEDIHGQILEDFGGLKREFAITETIHPAQTYKVTFNYQEFTVHFETKAVVNNYCKVNFEEYEIFFEDSRNILTNNQRNEIIKFTEKWILENRLYLQE